MLIIATFAETSLAQNPINFTEVILVDSTLSQKELFSKTLNFIAKNFTSANDVIQLKDEGAGNIVCKGSFQFDSKVMPTVTSGIIDFTLQISVKKGKYRYEFSNFEHKSISGRSYKLTYNPDSFSFGLIYDNEENTICDVDNLSWLLQPLGWKKKKTQIYSQMKLDCKSTANALMSILTKDINKSSIADNW